MNKRNETNELTIFFVVTIVITWVLWAPSVLANYGYNVPAVFLIISMLAGFTPSVVGLLLHRRYLGKDDFKADMSERLSLGFNKWWLLAIPLYFALTAAVGYGV